MIKKTYVKQVISRMFDTLMLMRECVNKEDIEFFYAGSMELAGLIAGRCSFGAKDRKTFFKLLNDIEQEYSK